MILYYYMILIIATIINGLAQASWSLFHSKRVQSSPKSFQSELEGGPQAKRCGNNLSPQHMFWPFRLHWTYSRHISDMFRLCVAEAGIAMHCDSMISMKVCCKPNGMTRPVSCRPASLLPRDRTWAQSTQNSHAEVISGHCSCCKYSIFYIIDLSIIYIYIYINKRCPYILYCFYPSIREEGLQVLQNASDLSRFFTGNQATSAAPECRWKGAGEKEEKQSAQCPVQQDFYPAFAMRRGKLFKCLVTGSFNCHKLWSESASRTLGLGPLDGAGPLVFACIF